MTLTNHEFHLALYPLPTNRCLLGCIAYFAIGIAVKHFVKGAQGIEVIPNINFWVGLPGLLKVSELSNHVTCITSMWNFTEGLLIPLVGWMLLCD